MGYLDDLLAKGERVIYVGRQHTFVLISNVLAELSLIAVLIAAGVASQTAFGAQVVGNFVVGQLVLLVCGVISLIILFSAFRDYLSWSNETYVITDQRVMQLRGTFNKEVLDSSLEKITDLELRQSWIGRIFDFGDIEILTASDIGANIMRKMAHPLDFKRAMLEAKNEHNRGYGYMDSQMVAPYTQPAQQANAPRRIEDVLQTLAQLRDQGILSAEEFEAKKRDLLSRM